MEKVLHEITFLSHGASASSLSFCGGCSRRDSHAGFAFLTYLAVILSAGHGAPTNCSTN